MRGTGTATLESKLAQQLAGLAHEPLFHIFMDVRKAYDSMERGCCLEILRGYGMGPKLARILKNYWKRKRIVPKAGKCLCTSLWTGGGVTQGDPISPMIFNIVVDAVVWAVLYVFCILQEAQHGMGWASGYINLVFYADDGRIAGRDHEWVQDGLTVTVSMLCRMGIAANFKKTKVMVCTPGLIWVKWEETAYKR